ncbi:hypothetical protein DFH27DRAFT_624772 [Peziza echinospora]|nr:hypothetical protein DFH27DRAFT_624772 [Peziza echinospora]
MATTLDEDQLIKSRPLTVEERPFKRLTKRCLPLLLPLPPLPTTTSQPPTPTATTTPPPNTTNPLLTTPLDTLLTDIDLDFTHFTHTLTRFHLLSLTNHREILRYEASKAQITASSLTAKLEMANLRAHLETAKREKEERLVYDQITSTMLPAGGREAIDRLNREIEELQEMGGRYEEVWRGRREVFDEVVGKLVELQGWIREEKEERERREGLGDEEGEEGEVGEEGELKVGGGGGGGSSSGGGGSGLISVAQTPLRAGERSEEGHMGMGDRMDTS